MKLWIRSQDRETMLPNPILIVDDNKILTPKNDYRNTHLLLGHYKTKERALEVLDEIQSRLSPKLHTVFTKDGLNVEVLDKNYDVYEMPKE